MYLVSVEKDFNISVGQDMIDVFKARFMKTFKTDVIKKAPVLSLNVEFREQLKTIYLHYSANNADKLDVVINAIDNLKQVQNENLEKLLDRDAKIDPLFEKLEMMNQFEDFRPSYKKTESSQVTAPVSDKPPIKSGGIERVRSTGKPPQQTSGLSKQAKFLTFAFLMVA